jgi:prolyl oligopeptidase
VKLLVPGAAALAAFVAAYPSTPKRPVVDRYHDVSVTDDYRWLENWNDPAVRTWTEQQNAATRAALDALPFMPALRSRVRAFGSENHPRWGDLMYRHGRLFAIKQQPPHQQPMLVALASPDDLGSERVIVDPVALDRSGVTAIDFYAPSIDGRSVAVSLSRNGTERGDVHIFESETGRELQDVIPLVNGGTAGGSVAWNADASGFFYTRYPHAGERPEADLDFYQQIYFHKIGTPAASDRYELGKDFPKIAETVLQASPDGQLILATVNNGDGGEKAHFVRNATGKWMQLAGYADEVVSGTWGRDDALYLVSRKNAPRGQVLRIARNGASLADARVMVRQRDTVVEDVSVGSSLVFVRELAGGPSRLSVFDFEGAPQRPVELAPVSSVTEVVPLDGNEILYGMQSFVTPPAFFRTSPAAAPKKTALAVTSSADYSDTDVMRVEATSKDGTRVPLNIVARKGTKLDGSNPTLLYAYGGYGISEVPTFSAVRRVWLEQGGVYVVANLRGGGEYGDEWHKGGSLTSKQNVFDDFAAAAQYLIEHHYTSPSSLAILGGSNGGLLMGATLTQHPNLFRAVVSHVGIYDMLRFNLWPNGAFNVTEYGDPNEPAQFRALFAYSPYHHVVDGTNYPAVLLFSGTNDPRVNPSDSRKFAARLQAASSSNRPVLLRISDSGHGFGTSLSEGLAQQADQYAFLFWQLEMKLSQLVGSR